MNLSPHRRRRASAVLVLCAGLLLAVPPVMALTPPAAQKGAQQGEGYRLPSAALPTPMPCGPGQATPLPSICCSSGVRIACARISTPFFYQRLVCPV